jgi:hypothetical protein
LLSGRIAGLIGSLLVLFAPIDKQPTCQPGPSADHGAKPSIAGHGADHRPPGRAYSRPSQSSLLGI